MAYVFENDLLRQELLIDVGGYISCWPAVPGVGKVAIDGTFDVLIFDPDGAPFLEAPGSAPSGLADGTDRLDVQISGALVTELGEGYRAEFTWEYTADDPGPQTRRSYVQFDVVRYLFASEQLITLRELQEIRPTIGVRLRKAGLLLDSTDTQPAESMASRFAANARVELDAKIHAAAGELGTIRARLILDRTRLARVERLLTLALIFEGDAAGGAEDDSEAAQLGAMYRAQAESAWKQLGPLQYDADEDGVPDLTPVRPGNQVTFLRRVQG